MGLTGQRCCPADVTASKHLEPILLNPTAIVSKKIKMNRFFSNCPLDATLVQSLKLAGPVRKVG